MQAPDAKPVRNTLSQATSGYLAQLFEQVEAFNQLRVNHLVRVPEQMIPN